MTGLSSTGNGIMNGFTNINPTDSITGVVPSGGQDVGGIFGFLAEIYASVMG
jgi:hypothetical protein